MRQQVSILFFLAPLLLLSQTDTYENLLIQQSDSFLIQIVSKSRFEKMFHYTGLSYSNISYHENQTKIFSASNSNQFSEVKFDYNIAINDLKHETEVSVVFDKSNNSWKIKNPENCPDYLWKNMPRNIMDSSEALSVLQKVGVKTAELTPWGCSPNVQGQFVWKIAKVVLPYDMYTLRTVYDIYTINAISAEVDSIKNYVDDVTTCIHHDCPEFISIPQRFPSQTPLDSVVDLNIQKIVVYHNSDSIILRNDDLDSLLNILKTAKSVDGLYQKEHSMTLKLVKNNRFYTGKDAKVSISNNAIHFALGQDKWQRMFKCSFVFDKPIDIELLFKRNASHQLTN